MFCDKGCNDDYYNSCDKGYNNGYNKGLGYSEVQLCEREGIGVSPPELISEVEYPHLNHYDAKIKIVPILINLNPLLSKICTQKKK